jgi:hypothetical protein
MSTQSRRIANARRAAKRLHASITNPVIDEDDPSAIIDVWTAGSVEVNEAFERKKPGRPGSTYVTTMVPRNRAEGTKWIPAEEKRRNRKAGKQRLPKNRDKRLKLLTPIVEEANRMLPDLKCPFTTKEFMPQEESRVYSRPRKVNGRYPVRH